MRQRFRVIDHRPGAGSEERFPQPGIAPESSIVVRSFAEAGEGGFRDDGFDARIDGGGLQGDARAHRFAKSKEMPRMLGGFQRIDDGARVVAFEPAVGGHRAFAGAVSAGVHHHHAVARQQQDAGVFEDSHAIVGDAVKKEHPIAVGLCGTHFPAAQKDAIGGAHVEVFAMDA